ncbi:MFS transporter [Sphingomonas sp. 1P06PA]|uniref:MFS transporter n=1 Tax=Sphingomonas sp. 1P06PA TaxID=554121 RepID=UPI0039A4430E
MTADADRRDFALLFLVMLTTAAGNTALQSVLPAIGRQLGLPDLVVALVFSFSALVWSLAAPVWARRSDRRGRRQMVLIGLGGFTGSCFVCALALTAGLWGWTGPAATFILFVGGRILYGYFGAAAPPAAQALVAARTGPGERVQALTLLASAFGLGTILGPALAPFFMLPGVGLAGPAYIFALFGVATWLVVGRLLGDERDLGDVGGAANAEPSIGGEPSGAAVIAAVNTQSPGQLAWNDARLWPWMVSGVVAGHAQAMASQAMGFLIIDRLALPPIAAQPLIGLVLMAGAGAALLAQWGIIPRLKLSPRALILWGAMAGAAGCGLIALADTIHALATSFAIASLGFGLLRPGFTAGASLAVGSREQGAVAGRVTSINGAVYVVGPAIGIALYQVARPLPYLAAAAALILLLGYALRALTPSARAG